MLKTKRDIVQTSIWSNLDNFQSPGGVDRASETQLQVGAIPFK